MKVSELFRAASRGPRVTHGETGPRYGIVDGSELISINKMNTRSRRWTFTHNNYGDDDIEMWNEIAQDITEHDIRRLIIGKEVGEKGTKHLQGYIGFTKAMTFGMIKKRYPKEIHWEVARGDEEQNEGYCSKEDLWIDKGQNEKKGKRNDLLRVRNAVSEGKGIRDMVDGEVVTSFQGLRMAQQLIPYYEQRRSWKPEVIWIWGPSGAGKSRMAFEMADGSDFYVKRGNMGKWWDGYDGQEVVIMDDLRGSHHPIEFLLGILDRYEQRIECKGGSRQLRARKIIITSIFSPEESYKHEPNEPIEQLLRRIDRVVVLTPP